MDPRRAAFRLQQLQLHLTAGSECLEDDRHGPAAVSRNGVLAESPTSKVCTAEEAVQLVPDGVWLTVSRHRRRRPPAATRNFRRKILSLCNLQAAGFVGTSCPELLLNALR